MWDMSKYMAEAAKVQHRALLVFESFLRDSKQPLKALTVALYSWAVLAGVLSLATLINLITVIF